MKKERLQVTQDRKADGGSGGRGGWSDKERETEKMGVYAWGWGVGVEEETERGERGLCSKQGSKGAGGEGAVRERRERCTLRGGCWC